MNRHNRAPTIGMLQKMMTAFDPHDFKTGALQYANHLAATAAGKFRHD
jgi:hypothetical protein